METPVSYDEQKSKDLEMQRFEEDSKAHDSKEEDYIRCKSCGDALLIYNPELIKDDLCPKCQVDVLKAQKEEEMENKDLVLSAEVPLKDKLAQPKTIQSEIMNLLPSAGTLEITSDQRKILFAPVKEEDIEIRPDGLIYLPWMEYVTRLREAFDVNWAIIPESKPSLENNYVYIKAFLIINGKLMGFAMGEQQYFPNSPTMTYGDALEGATSNALMRLCKRIGIGLELWKPSFIRAWKEKYAETYFDSYKNKKLWRKKGNGNGSKTEQEPPKIPELPTEQIQPKSIAKQTEPLTVEEALKQNIVGNIFDCVGSLQNIKERKTKNDKDITDYILRDLVTEKTITIMKWGKLHENLHENQTIIFRNVKVGIYYNQLTYTAEKMEIV